MFLAVSERRFVSTRDIEQDFRVSRDHLKKVIPELASAGWVVTKRGRNGGVRLNAETKDIRLSEVVEHFEPLEPLDCFSDGSEACPIAAGCALKPAIWGAMRAYVNYLEQFTLADITENRCYLRSALSMPAMPQ
jgi:Rrf2 family nitric oxide-sensitive transcriptional repressor